MGLFSAIGGIAGRIIGGPAGGAIGSTLGGAIDSSGNSKSIGAAGGQYNAGLSQALQALTQGSLDTEARTKPTADIGTNSIGRLNDILVNGDMSKFYDNPAYQYALDQSMRGIQANAAAKGTLMSGSTLKALQQNASGLASQNYNSYITNLGNLFGQTSPYLTSYNEMPYQRAQDQANIIIGQAANSRDTKLGQMNATSRIGSELGGVGSSVWRNPDSGTLVNSGGGGFSDFLASAGNFLGF